MKVSRSIKVPVSWFELPRPHLFTKIRSINPFSPWGGGRYWAIAHASHFLSYRLFTGSVHVMDSTSASIDLGGGVLV